MPNITPAQTRGARAMLGGFTIDLATVAGLSLSTMKGLDRAVSRGARPRPHGG